MVVPITGQGMQGGGGNSSNARAGGGGGAGMKGYGITMVLMEATLVEMDFKYYINYSTSNYIIQLVK